MTSNIYLRFIYVRHTAKCFINFVSFNTGYSYSILYRGKLELERLSNLFKVTQLVNGEIGICTKETYIHYIILLPYTESM